MRTVYLAPSDIRYMIDRCERCWWLKTRYVRAPREAMPSIFSNIDRGMKAAIGIEQMQQLGFDVKEVVPTGELKCKPMVYGDVQIIISGQLDRCFLNADDTLTVVDFKTTEPSRGKLPLFGRQLHAYQRCLEDPMQGEGREVTRLSLVPFDCSAGRFDTKPPKIGAEDLRFLNGSIVGTLTRHDIEIDRAAFSEEIERIAAIAGCQEMPTAGANCDVCRHAAAITSYALEHSRLMVPK